MADSSSFAVLNLGSQRVSGAVFTKDRAGGLVLKQVEFAEMHGDPSMEATRLPQLRVAVLELVDKLKIKGSTVWYSIAGHVVFTRFVKLPPFQDDKADQIVEFEARQNVPFPINEVIWDYEFLGDKTGPEREVVLVAIRADALNDINEQLESNGVRVSGVDLAPMAAYNAFRYGYPDVEESALIVDLGSKSTNLIFVEGGKIFTRNILVGGATVTGAIAKEMGIQFGEAEQQKRTHGFIAPGGAYEPHENETVDAISRIMRNTMTRLHGEVIRTVNFYRTQQGGQPPRRIFICGGGAQTPMVVEFFQEKFNLPVEVLNPLRGVQVSGSASATAQVNAPGMAELVGLALRHLGAAPVEIELVPDSVAQARDSAKRAPYLLMAAACLFALLGVGIFYFKQASGLIDTKMEGLKKHYSELSRQDSKRKDLENQLDDLRRQSVQLQDAVRSRGWWDRLLAALNGKFSDDYVWITQLEVLKNGNVMTPSLATGTNPAASAPPALSPAAAAAAAAEPKYELSFHGLYRRNTAGGQQVVYKYYDGLKTLTDFFGTPAPDSKPEVDAGLEEDRYAYKYKFRLPLQPGMKFDK
jgi:type IV pilus assembly protein PilM